MGALTMALTGGLTTAAVPHQESRPVAIWGEVLGPKDSHVTLDVRLWPRPWALEQLVDGDTVPFYSPDHVEIEGNSFTVYLDPTSIPDEYIGSATNDDLERAVDIEVTAVAYGEGPTGAQDSPTHDPIDVVTYDESVQWSTDSTSPETWDRFTAAALDGADQPARLTIDGSQEQPASLTLLDNTTDPSHCLTPIWDRYTPADTIRYAAPGTIYTEGSNPSPKGRYSWSEGGRHSVAVGFRNAWSGSISMSGMTGRSFSWGSTGPWTSGKHIIRTQWEFHGYRSTGPCSWDYRKRRPERHLGGYSAKSVSRSTYTKCVPMDAGSTFKRTERTQATLSAGVSLWNFNMSTQSGFAVDSTLHYTRSAPFRVCGNDDYPGFSKRVLAKP